MGEGERLITRHDMKEQESTGVLSNNYARRVLLVAGIFLALLLLWYAADVLLLAFAGVLLAIFLRGLSDLVSEHTPVPAGWSLWAVVLALTGLLALAGWLLAPEVGKQVDQMVESLPASLGRLREYLGDHRWGRQLLQQIDGGALLPERSSVLSRATGILSTTLGFVTDIVIVLFAGLYFAAKPSLYTEGLLTLIPGRRRPRAREVLNVLNVTLRRWLVGRSLLMLSNGVVTAIGLWLMGVPLALTLGLLSALLNFIPNIGPLLAAVPAVLVALLQGPTQALYVALFYVAYQSLDGYVLTPLVQHQTVSLPPALVILGQVLLGVLAGGMGVLLATPLVAVAFVLVKLLYVEDVLGQEVTLPGEADADDG